jgi:hypothetical protein
MDEKEVLADRYRKMYEGMISKDMELLDEVLIGQSRIEAAVFGGRKSKWNLQQKLSLKKRGGIWFITKSVASTYN